jgi:diacylglycerol kinase family enzyme
MNRTLVLMNRSAGTLTGFASPDEPRQRIERGLRDAGVGDVRVEIVEPDRLAEAARNAHREGFDAVIGAGGDGTLNTIANALADGPVVFGVLPLGTHNHFAKELGSPLDLDESVRALAAGHVEELDVAEVNGRIFLNFSAIGFHPRLVKHREAQRDVLGRRKFVAMLVALLSVLRRLPVMRVRLGWGGVTIRRVTPSVIIANNRHQMQVFGVENLSSDDRRMLNVYVARATRWWGLVWLMIRAAFRSLHSARKFEAFVLPEVTVETRNRHVHVSIDGEVTDLRSPLHYRVRRGGLKVIRPAAPATAATTQNATV